MTTNDPEAIRADIARTRSDLSENVDALTDRVNPSTIAHRQGERVRDAVTGAKDRVFGTASDARDKVFGAASDAGDSVRDQADRAGELAREAPHRVKEKAEGNPLAAGLIAFGVGLLVAGLVPSSRKERELVEQARSSDALSQATEEVKSVAKESAEHLREPAQQAVQDVKDTATEGAQHVREEGTGAAQDVRSQAEDSARTVREDH